MAQNRPKVLLGFEDEIINDKFKSQTNFTTNKIGGRPDLPANVTLETPKCPLCQLPRPLVLQLYAPLDTTYHRTLYLYACINPNCWNCGESWTCIRVQSLEAMNEPSMDEAASKPHHAAEWCTGADDWDDDNNPNMNEQNGNLINNNERISDEDEESCSLEESVRAGLGNLTVDDCNANNGGAVGRLHSPSATAEIEGDEGEIISIDTPTVPQHDVVALLQEVTPLPQELCQSGHQLAMWQFAPVFLSVWEETFSNPITDVHVKELLQGYQQYNDDLLNLSPDNASACVQINENSLEKYEKSTPAHGDKMFHYFLTKIQMNPGQILRYSRDVESPLLLYPLQDSPKKCRYCQGEIIFEFQVLPTIIPKLRLLTDMRNSARLEFGTVMIFTCRKSCWSTDTNLRYETVVLQNEIY